VSEARIIVLGLIAGGSIFLGLPIGRMKRPAPQLRQFLNALAIGILIFLLWDVLAHAYDPITMALSQLHHHSGSLTTLIGYTLLFFGGLGVGLLSLTYYDKFLKRQKPRPAGPGAMATTESLTTSSASVSLSPAERLGLLIAVGIGLHNFAEGLAIGQSAALGAVSLATVLVIGFALHNATEGFGVVAPMAAAGVRPTWGFLILLGCIGGGPTVLGTIIGSQFTSISVSIVFLMLAAGSILFVVLQLLAVAFKQAQPRTLAWGLLAGLAIGFLTDMVVTAGGA
jgi:ZIP family zinc transporter